MMDTAMYYFDALPLHPRLQPLESFTSYLISCLRSKWNSTVLAINSVLWRLLSYF